MKAIYIILDESKQIEGTSPDVDFVEIENENGESINIGERESYGGYGDNCIRLRITADDIDPDLRADLAAAQARNAALLDLLERVRAVREHVREVREMADYTTNFDHEIATALRAAGRLK